MRSILCAIALFTGLAATLAGAETFIGPTTATNRLLVPANSAIIITATLGDFTNSTTRQAHSIACEFNAEWGVGC